MPAGAVHNRGNTSDLASDVEETREEAKKPYRQILAEEISEGKHEMERPTLGLLLSAFSAGLDIGFSLLLMGVVQTMLAGANRPFLTTILLANLYSVGFLFVVLGRSELFTEHTTLAVLPVLNRQSSLADLMRLWSVVYVGNLAGAAVFAAAGGLRLLDGER